MKIKRRLLCFAIPCLLISGMVTNVNAAESVDDGIAEPRGPVCDSHQYYELSSATDQYTYDQQGEFRNAGSQVQSKSVSYTTTYTSTISSSVSSELDLIAAKLNATLQVSAGSSRSVTLTSIFNISPRSVGHYKVGQKRKNTSGYIVTVYDNCTTRQKYVTSNFSLGPYDSYYETGI